MVKKLEEYGHIVNRAGRFAFAIGATGILQGSVHNGRNSINGNSVNGSGSFDFTITSSFAQYYVATVHLEAGVYNGLDNTFKYPLLFGKVNADDRGTGKNLALNNAECFLEAKFFDGKFGLAAGLLDPAVFFDRNMAANDEKSQFLNQGFKNDTTLEFPQNYAVGGLTTVTAGMFGFKAGVMDAASTGMNMEDNLFWIGEFSLSPVIGERKQNFRVYGWGNHDNTTGSPKKASAWLMGYGFGASFDEEIASWFKLFQRAGYARKSAYTAYMSFSGGFELLGSLYNREFDQFGMGAGVAITNKSLVPRNEYVIEAYYNLGLAKNHVHLAPDVQFVIDPAGRSDLRNPVFLGLRAQLVIPQS